MISKVEFRELDEVFQLTKSCAEDLIKQGIFQWNEKYPSREILENDIAKEQLWKVKNSDNIAGIICISSEMDEEYKNIPWFTKDFKNCYIHRLAVHPSYQRKGYARMLMDFAESYAKSNNFISVRLDTFSKNNRNQKFYKARSYTFVGEVFFPNQSNDPFYCFEKLVNE